MDNINIKTLVVIYISSAIGGLLFAVQKSHAKLFADILVFHPLEFITQDFVWLFEKNKKIVEMNGYLWLLE